MPRLISAALVGLLCSVTWAQPLAIIDADQPAGGWKLGLGREFPGARGELKLAAERFEGRPVLQLEADFSAGGKYIEAATDLPDVSIDAVSFWLNAPVGADTIVMRLIDGSGQVHQFRLKISDRGGWQKIDFPLLRYFKTVGTPDAVPGVAQYENWSGANDSRWHQPAKYVTILTSENFGKQSTLQIRDFLLHPAAGRGVTVPQTVALDEMLTLGRIDWVLNLGWEFKGAKGDVELLRDAPEPGRNAMRLTADFTGGGAYVGVKKNLADYDIVGVDAIRMKLRSPNAERITLLLVDGSGQVHQRKGVPITGDDNWHNFTIDPRRIAGGEHWGGANDGRWHDPIQLIQMSLTPRGSNQTKKLQLDLADMAMDVRVETRMQPTAMKIDFDDAPLADWQREGDVTINAGSLQLARSLEQIHDATSATSPAFDVAPGLWQVAFKQKSDLHSPDNSYHARVDLVVFDRAGKSIDTLPLTIQFGKHDWGKVTKPVELPAGAATARVKISLQKTYGTYQLDDLAAAPLRLGAIVRKVKRIELSSDALGNLFMPGDPVVVHAKVIADKPLTEPERRMRYKLRDASGALVIEPAAVVLNETQGDRDQFVYTADIALRADDLMVGRFYELDVEVPQGDESADEFTGLAILPRAASKDYAPSKIPFTIRNWDSRIPPYFQLADRLGIRQIGLWGGWSSKPPYKASLPGLEQVQQLDAGWLTGTPASKIEDEGFKTYSESALREGMTNFLEKYADQGLIAIAIGNEPHGTGQTVIDNVRAYKAIYESAKAHDQNITVLGTSVEPNREYFEAGYQNYLDAYDFHIYESYRDVRRTMREYRALMKEFDAVKPIHSTELGLNSLGQTRRTVSISMIKKLTSFFAEGGATVSWFTIMYPDREGKARGTFGNAHCVFDCQYNLYNPRLDAITEYHLINSFLDKRFIAEKQYDDGVQAYLFRDDAGRAMVVLWQDESRSDVTLPIQTSGDVKRVLLDGSTTTMKPVDGKLTLTVDHEPILLLFDGPEMALPQALPPSSMRLVKAPKAISSGKTAEITLVGVLPQAVRVVGPALWATKVEPVGDDGVKLVIDVPTDTPARQAHYLIHHVTDGQVVGEVRVAMPVK
ncbi:hypothetical protein HED60_08445 [Planctomycetales bacterium ZRK34]|nr:hypothetical protein HED60_08445 [Planctomycetales bacterium ZRK34]